MPVAIFYTIMWSLKATNKGVFVNATNGQHYILEPATFRLDGGAMFGIIPRPLWQKVAPPDDQNRILLALRLWLIKTADKTILIDTGIGDYHNEKFDKQFDVQGPKDPLGSALKEINLTRNDISDLIISHLHFDHVGGIAREENGKLVSSFPNARLHIHREHYNYSLSPTQRDGGSFHKHIYNPIIEDHEKRGLVHWYQGEEGELFDGISFKVSFGHTPWLLHPIFDGHIYLTDLVPTSHHVHIPWVMGYDIEPGRTTKYKEDFLSYIVENDLICIYEHDPQYWGSKIVKTEKGFRANTPISKKDGSAYSI